MKKDFEIKTALGTRVSVEKLYSFPNLKPHDTTTEPNVQATIKHYIDLSLLRDGLAAEGAEAEVTKEEAGEIQLVLRGPRGLAGDLRTFAENLVEMLAHARAALMERFPVLEHRGPRRSQNGPRPWDPGGAGWRPFFGHGLPMVRHRCVQFFHYPPIRLLDYYRDYLHDPVPRKIEQLLLANIGWNELLAHGEAELPSDRQAAHQLALYERVVDGCPIAAPDDAGSGDVPITDTHGKEIVVRGAIPMEDFIDYQRSELGLFLRDHPEHQTHTIPLIAYGQPASAQLDKLFGTPTLANAAAAPTAGTGRGPRGKLMPYVVAAHPYHFFWWAQGEKPAQLGKGALRFSPERRRDIETLVINDLAVAGWSLAMYEDPTRDSAKALMECQEVWRARPREVSALIRHMGSYEAYGTNDLEYRYRESIADALAYVSTHADPYGDVKP